MGKGISLYVITAVGACLLWLGQAIAQQQYEDPEKFTSPDLRPLKPFPKPKFPVMICNKIYKFFMPPWWAGGVDLVFRTLKYDSDNDTLKYVISNLRAGDFSGNAVIWLLRKRTGQDPQATETILIWEGFELVQLTPGTTILDVPGAGEHPEETSSFIAEFLPQDIYGWIDVQYIAGDPEANPANNVCKISSPFPQ